MLQYLPYPMILFWNPVRTECEPAMNETLRNLYARLEQLCSQKDIGEGKNLLSLH